MIILSKVDTAGRGDKTQTCLPEKESIRKRCESLNADISPDENASSALTDERHLETNHTVGHTVGHGGLIFVWRLDIIRRQRVVEELMDLYSPLPKTSAAAALAAGVAVISDKYVGSRIFLVNMEDYKLTHIVSNFFAKTQDIDSFFVSRGFLDIQSLKYNFMSQRYKLMNYTDNFMN